MVKDSKMLKKHHVHTQKHKHTHTYHELRDQGNQCLDICTLHTTTVGWTDSMVRDHIAWLIMVTTLPSDYQILILSPLQSVNNIFLLLLKPLTKRYDVDAV